MPHLKKLEIQGFKSFADPLTLLYPTGVTAIVGPNGSGKSNVADAIRWVLGEQRMTAIRGRSGEDMIFAGSKKRPRAGMARVAITFDNSDHWLAVDFAEVTLERRTYRDGKTDYLVNGSRVRLMDLRDILDRAGLGRDAYLIIGQGLVDHVLALRPHERLALFEQASGIAPYRARREESVRRLDETQRNLERVQDIVGEIEPGLRKLRRQAERAGQYVELTGLLNETLRVWYGYHWGRGVANLEDARRHAAYYGQRAHQRVEESEGLEATLAAQRQELNERRTQLAELHRLSSQRHTEAEQQQRDLAVARERFGQLQERREEAQAHLAPLRAALEAQAAEATTLQARLEAARAQVEAERVQLAAVEAEYHALERRRQALLTRQAQAQSAVLEGRHQVGDRRNRMEQAAERLAALAARVAELEAALAAATERRRAQQAAVEQARQLLEAAEAAVQQAQAEAERLQVAQETVRAESERLRRQLSARQAEAQQMAARLDVLERLHAEGAGLYAGVRAVLQAAERGELRGLPGAIASLIQAPAQLERALETALGGQLQNVVAERWADAQAGIEWLKRRRAGRATFLPLDTLRPQSPLEVPQMAGVVGLAADLIRYETRYRSAVQLLLGRTAVAETLDAARELYRRLSGGFQIVTLDGEIVRSGGAVTGGEEQKSRPDGGLLARERERRELPAQVAALEQEVAGLRAALQAGEAQAQTLAQEGRAAGERLRLVVRQRTEAERSLERLVRDLDKLIQEGEWQRRLLEETGAERERLAALHARLGDEAQALATALAESEARLAELGRELAGLGDQALAATLAERRTQVALLTQDHDNRQATLKTRRREVQRLEEQIAGQERHAQELAAALAQLEAQLAAAQTQYERARAAADALAAQAPPLEAALAGLERALVQREEAAATARRALREAEQRSSQAELEASRREEQVQALRREIEEALGVVVGDLPEALSGQQPLPLDAIVLPLPTVDTLPDGLERQIGDLRTQIRRLEPVNLAAKEEYDELTARHTFLRDQMNDLTTAAAHLQKIIAELDEMMDASFRTTFKAIAAEFVRMFKLLFNGGTAALTLEGEGEGLGVEITARPPGKRTSGLGMLSGGERTLTAVALLFAVMRVSPTPFCILDEVDAMLDEANVGRFRAMLGELARETQFIIITHNRGTVEVADTIYGVSMGEDSVSQVLSLSLEDIPAAEPQQIESNGSVSRHSEARSAEESPNKTV